MFEAYPGCRGEATPESRLTKERWVVPIAPRAGNASGAGGTSRRAERRRASMVFDRIRRSIRLKVTVLVLAIALAALVCTGTILVLLDLRQHRQGWVTDLVTQAEIVGRTSAP